MFKKKYAKLIFSLCASSFFVFLAAVYASTKPELKILGELVRLLKSDAELFKTFYANGFLTFMLIILSVFSGADLISSDLKFKAFPLYFSRPLSRGDYLAGKFAVILFYLLAFTLVPGVLLLLFKMLFTGSLAVSPVLLLAILVFPLIECLCLASLTLALSILSPNTKFIQIAIFLVYIFSNNLAQMLKAIFKSDYSFLVSLHGNIQQLAKLPVRRQAGLRLSRLALAAAAAGDHGAVLLAAGLAHQESGGRRMTPVLKAEKLSKWYGNILGISDINLEIGSGITGLLGPNGAGKSTFLKIAAGQLKPKIGTLTVFGEAVFGNPRLFRRIGFCPEHDSAYAEMSGREFILLLARLHGFAGAEAGGQDAKRPWTRSACWTAKDRPIKGYSFGMRQRLRLASSILHEPELLMLDEPLRGVDPLWRIRIMQLIKDYGRQGRTVIVSSHILPEIEAMTSEIVLIHQGKIFAKGDIHRIRGLIDSHPHQVSIRTPQPRRLAARLIGSDFVSSVEFAADGRGLTVQHRPARPLLHRPHGPASPRAALEVEEITSPDDNLQAVFDYLIGK